MTLKDRTFNVNVLSTKLDNEGRFIAVLAEINNFVITLVNLNRPNRMTLSFFITCSLVGKIFQSHPVLGCNPKVSSASAQEIHSYA